MKIRITPKIRRAVAPVRNSLKREVKEVSGYYVGNAKKGWDKGEKRVNEKDIGLAPAFFIKSLYAVANTKIRGKDVLPLIGCALFTFTNPFIGMGFVGFALGKSINKIFSKFVKGINLSAYYMPPR